jgi:hypothetical protein
MAYLPLQLIAGLRLRDRLASNAVRHRASSNDQQAHERRFLHSTNDSGPSKMLGPFGCCAALNRTDAPACTA